jgi:T-complex protein 1 subunit alpha
VGDGTTSVVIVAGELLKRAGELIKMGVHPTTIITGYKLSAREACRYIEDKLAVSVDSLGDDALLNCARTSISSKLIHADSTFFARLALEAVSLVKKEGPRGTTYPIKAINILKAHGQSSTESQLVKGYALQTLKAHLLMPS